MKRMLCFWVIVTFLIGTIAVPVHAGDAISPISPQVRKAPPAQQRTRSYVGTYDTHSNPPGELLIADALILRPLGIVASAIGFVSASFITMPWASSSDSFDRVERELIVKPFEYTFCRPLGDLDY